jgi:16S rRNA G1207 methylase RsmC
MTYRWQFQDAFYAKFISPYTAKLYKAYFEDESIGSSILDVGVGNALAMLENADLVKNKSFDIEGIDINCKSVEIAEFNVKRFGMSDRIAVKCEDLFKYDTTKKYNTILFSESWAVVPCIKDMIMHSIKYLKEKGKIVIITTLDENPSFFLRWVKPKIKYVFGDMNNFGRVTTVKEMQEFCSQFKNAELKVGHARSLPLIGIISTYIITITP